MKLTKFIYNEGQDVVQNAIDTVTMHLLAYGKIYELLHMQLWRKAPSRIWRYSNPLYTMHNGRPVQFIRGWNIKSPSTSPYSRDGGDHTFGLNQLFVGQDFRKAYIGNPKSGIYHDDCYIQPKAYMIESGQVEYFCYYQTSSEEAQVLAMSFQKQNADGTIRYSNVVYSTYSSGTPSKTYCRLTATKGDGSTEITELGELSIATLGSYVVLKKGSQVGLGVQQWIQEPNYAEHGAVLHTEIIPNNTLWVITSGTITQASDGWIKVFQDGTVIEYVPYAVEDYGDGLYNEVVAHYKILPMLYTDTGDLTMDRVEFVEKWNDYFELIVHEDSEWWEKFVTPLVAIITVVVAIYTGIVFNPIGAVGTALSVTGTLSGDKTMSLLGGIMMAGAGVYNVIEESFADSLYKAGAVGTQADVIGNASFGTMFENFTSNAGFGNLAQIGSKVFSIGSDISQLGKSTDTQVVNSVTDSDDKKILFIAEDKDIFDPNAIIGNVIDIK